ncbi:hypothetical protein CDIK_0669 [Cucumispora dikerogammari]|nr:hypothetical protein CDIK_0669 [Cucumispora dikerogammari]
MAKRNLIQHILLKDSSHEKELSKSKPVKDIEIKNSLTERFIKFSGFCLVTGSTYGLIKSSLVYHTQFKKNVFVSPNIFEKYSLFYANRFLLNGNLIFWGSHFFNKYLLGQ